MSAGLERRVQKLEEEFEREFAKPVRFRLYWVDPRTGESEPAWSDEEEAEYQREDEEKWRRWEGRGESG